jgi:DNA-binding XRE family transcriptional regulator
MGPLKHEGGITFEGMQLPDKLKAKRRVLYTAEEIAREVGVSRATIHKLEKDPLSVKGHTLRSYLLALGWRVRVAPAFHLNSPHC